MTSKKSFASDNNSPVHEKIMKAILRANEGDVLSYGNDRYTQAATERFKQMFGEDIDVYFVYNGTGANVTGLTAVTSSFYAIICAQTAHLNVDECGAPEKLSGCKVISLPTDNGKIQVEQIKKHLQGFGDQHHSQPKVISITQSTEYGTIYQLEEVQAIADLAHQHGMLLHMDGARIANAAVALNKGLREITRNVEVDVLSFGGTKNGLMFGEAVVFFNRELSQNFKYYRKQGMQLHSKMRYISAQFEELLTDNLWWKNAKQANDMAKLLADKVRDIPQVKITQEVEANVVFTSLPEEVITRLQEKYTFYVWNASKSEVRWMTSFNTTEEDILDFVAAIKSLVGRQ